MRYRTVAEEMRKVKATMQHPEAAKYVTHGLRKNATIELYLAGCDDEMVKAVTGHSGVEMLKKYGGQIRQRELATRAQDARNRMERNKPGNMNVSTPVSKIERMEADMTQVIENIGGEYRNRTGVHGFAIRCVTTPPTRRSEGGCDRIIRSRGVGARGQSGVLTGVGAIDIAAARLMCQNLDDRIPNARV